MMRKIAFSFLIILMGSSVIWAGWHDRKAEGWAWYEDRNKKEEQPPEELPKSSSDEMQAIRKNIEDKLAKAVLEPTSENIKAYMEEQQKWVERSSQFANVWAQVLLNNPYLDYTATHMPISQYGLQFYKKELQEKKEALIATLSKEFGLFFFYLGKDEVSKMFGRIVQSLASKYNYEVIPVSLDGLELEEFPNSRNNNGIAKSLGVDVLPALYLINPKENVAIPIAFGLVAMDQIENNIFLQFSGESR